MIKLNKMNSIKAKKIYLNWDSNVSEDGIFRSLKDVKTVNIKYMYIYTTYIILAIKKKITLYKIIIL